MVCLLRAGLALALLITVGCGGRHSGVDDGGPDADADLPAVDGDGDVDEPDAAADADEDTADADVLAERWLRTWPGVTAMDGYQFSVGVANDGDVLLAGRLDSEIFVARVGRGGEVLWQRTITTRPFHEGWASGVLETVDGRVLVLGEDLDGSSLRQRTWLGELDEEGNIVRQRYLSERPVYGRSTMALAPDGTLVISAYSGGSSVLLRYSEEEGILWERTIIPPGDLREALPVDIVIGADGSMLLASFKYLSWLDSEGLPISMWELEGDCLVCGEKAAFLPDGDALLVGGCGGAVSVSRASLEPGASWTVNVSYPGSTVYPMHPDEAGGVTFTEDGEILVSGTITAFHGDDSAAMLLLWLDLDGGILRHRGYGVVDPREYLGAEPAYGVLAPEGQIVFAGEVSQDLALARTDAAGEIGGCGWDVDPPIESATERCELTVTEVPLELVDVEPEELPEADLVSVEADVSSSIVCR